MNRTRNAIIVIALLGAVAVVNYFGSPRSEPEASQNESEQHAAEAEAAADAPEAPEEDEHVVTQPAIDPFGADDALVKLEVFYEEENDCHSGIASQACDLTQRYQPYVQLQLRPWNAEGTQERADELNAHCLVVVALSTRDANGQWGPGEVEFMAPPDTDEWGWGDLGGVIATKLNEAGVEMSPAELLARSANPSGASSDVAETEQ